MPKFVQVVNSLLSKNRCEMRFNLKEAEYIFSCTTQNCEIERVKLTGKINLISPHLTVGEHNNTSGQLCK